MCGHYVKLERDVREKHPHSKEVAIYLRKIVSIHREYQTTIDNKCYFQTSKLQVKDSSGFSQVGAPLYLFIKYTGL